MRVELKDIPHKIRIEETDKHGDPNSLSMPLDCFKITIHMGSFTSYVVLAKIIMEDKGLGWCIEYAVLRASKDLQNHKEKNQ